MADYELPESDSDLLDQCDVTTFRATGPGGQGVNTTDSAVRLKHRPTGLVVVCRRERSQYLNKKECLRRLRQRIAGLLHEPPERVPTAPSAAAERRRLEDKKRRAKVKAQRTAPVDEE